MNKIIKWLFQIKIQTFDEIKQNVRHTNSCRQALQLIGALNN